LDNSTIIEQLRTTATLLALHDANPFQVKHYHNAALFLEKFNQEVMSLKPEELARIPGISQGLMALIEEFRNTGTLSKLQELQAQTPTGIWDMLAVPGLGPKRVRLLWKEMGIQNVEELKEACQRGQVEKLPGFGKKTQETILKNLSEQAQYQHLVHYATALQYATLLEATCKKEFPTLVMKLVGEMRRKVEVISNISWLVASTEPLAIMNWLSSYPLIRQDKAISGPLAWRGHMVDNPLTIQFLFCHPDDFYQQLIMQTGSPQHLALPLSSGHFWGEAVMQAKGAPSEADIYQAANLPFIPAELREGLVEYSWIAAGTPPLVERADLQGIFHVHTTYSDGKNSLEDMVTSCQQLGYSYIGITDHSQTAAYAGGLRPPRVHEQHQHIDRLNQRLAPFKIFKGIESDILSDGSLDYPDEVLAQFDFIIASIHSGLNMSQTEATERLIKVISNPFTTILGHPTGRLLLRRKGYPIDHQAVIDACAAHGVIIEINANPWRLDIDWHWIPYAIKKGVKLIINPDAHSHKEFDNILYGVEVGRKGGLTKVHTFNALSRAEVESYLLARKERAHSLRAFKC
jgi:DNA polymerase (family 10)